MAGMENGIGPTSIKAGGLVNREIIAKYASYSSGNKAANFFLKGPSDAFLLSLILA